MLHLEIAVCQFESTNQTFLHVDQTAAPVELNLVVEPFLDLKRRPPSDHFPRRYLDDFSRFLRLMTIHQYPWGHYLHS